MVDIIIRDQNSTECESSIDDYNLQEKKEEYVVKEQRLLEQYGEEIALLQDHRMVLEKEPIYTIY